MIDATQFPHLARAMLFGPTEGGHGSCFHRAVALLLDMKGGKLAIGTVRAATDAEALALPGSSRVPFIHAWIEHGPVVLAPSLIERMGELAAIDRANYYEQNDVRDVHYLTRAQVKRLAKAHGWSKHFLRNRPARLSPPLGTVVLDAARVPYRLQDGGVVPL